MEGRKVVAVTEKSRECLESEAITGNVTSIFLSSSTCKKCGRSISLAFWVSLVVFPSGPLAGSSSPKIPYGPSSPPHGQDAFLAPAMPSMVEKSCPGSRVVLGGTQTWAYTLAPPGSGLSSVMWIDNNSCIELLWVVHGISEHI